MHKIGNNENNNSSNKNQTLIMGIVNITPDSFSDGGKYLDPNAAYEHAAKLVEEGADIIDLGAESSRPDAQFINIEEEWKRLLPILKLLEDNPLPVKISIDTNKPEVMRRLTDFNVHIINDIKGGADSETLEHLAKKDLYYLAMHMHGTPEFMQKSPLSSGSALIEVNNFYKNTQKKLTDIGFNKEKIWLDPGIGFGKSDAANIQLLADSIQKARNYNLVMGISRKSFMGRLLDIKDPTGRDAPTKMLELSFIFAGVKVIRTHDVSRLYRLRELYNIKES